MTSIRVATTIEATTERVWGAVEDIASHTRWMDDAIAIRFTSPQRSGVGTTFDCDTRIGPLRVLDRMEVTEWDPPWAMGIRHAGLVTGAGRFTLADDGGGTRFTWQEELFFPWWMGAQVGGAAATPLLRRVWRRNLRNLKMLVERSPAV